MVGFPDGPLTGAPINFPRSVQPGECCPPVLLQLQGYEATYDVADFELTIEGVKICDDDTVELVAYSKTTPTTPVPVLLAVACDVGTPPNLDTMVLTMDTNRSRGAFAVKITNACGCSELVPVTLVPPI